MCHLYTLKNAGLFEPKFGSNMDKPKYWVKNVISNFNPTSTFTFNCNFFNYIFNSTFGFFHIWPKFGFKQPSIFYKSFKLH